MLPTSPDGVHCKDNGELKRTNLGNEQIYLNHFVYIFHGVSPWSLFCVHRYHPGCVGKTAWQIGEKAVLSLSIPIICSFRMDHQDVWTPSEILQYVPPVGTGQRNSYLGTRSGSAPHG